MTQSNLISPPPRGIDSLTGLTPVPSVMKLSAYVQDSRPSGRSGHPLERAGARLLQPDRQVQNDECAPKEQLQLSREFRRVDDGREVVLDEAT